jgi:predicted PurR-regulated permease PerM
MTDPPLAAPKAVMAVRTPEEPPPPPEVTVWSSWSRRVASILLLVLAVWLVYLGRSILPILVVAAILSFLVQPFIRRLEARGLTRPRAVALVYLYVIAAAVIALVIGVPRIVAELRDLVGNFVAFWQASRSQVQSVLDEMRNPRVLGVAVDLSFLVDPVEAALAAARIPPELIPSPGSLVDSAQSLVRVASGLVVSLSGLVFSAFLALFFSMHMSLDGPRILGRLAAYTGDDQSAEYRMLASNIERTWTGFFRGQVILSLVIGSVVTIGALVLGLPGALVLGILAGVLEVLPNLGPVLATVPAVVVALVEGSSHLPVSNLTFALIVVGFYILVQQLENIVVVPRVLGDAVDLPPLVVMVAVVVGAQVAGVLGAFVAAPLAASLREIVRYTLEKIRGTDPYPELRARDAQLDELPLGDDEPTGATGG